MFRILLFLFIAFPVSLGYAQQTKLALSKYNGGGDWYANLQTSLPNLIRFANDNGLSLNAEQAIVEPGSLDLFAYPFVHLTGHGNIVLSGAEAENLRNYMLSGGFLHIDDNYGMDPFIRIAVKQIFPEYAFVPLPVDHPIFKAPFSFPKGLPKIHAHDNKPPEALGIFHEGRLVCLYTHESDLGDGWEDPDVHGDTPQNHLEALQMGVNILSYVFMGGTEIE